MLISSYVFQLSDALADAVTTNLSIFCSENLFSDIKFPDRASCLPGKATPVFTICTRFTCEPGYICQFSAKVDNRPSFYMNGKAGV